MTEYERMKTKCDALRSRAEAAERDLGTVLEDARQAQRKATVAKREAERMASELTAAEDEMEALRDELATARDLLRGVVNKPLLWYENICDYLETLDE